MMYKIWKYILFHYFKSWDQCEKLSKKDIVLARIVFGIKGTSVNIKLIMGRYGDF